MAESTPLSAIAASLGGEHMIPTFATDGRQIGWVEDYVTAAAAEVYATAVIPEVERIVAARETAARADERAKVAAAVEVVLSSSARHNSLVETVQLRRRVRAALAPTTHPQPTEVAGELWLLDGSGR